MFITLPRRYARIFILFFVALLTTLVAVQQSARAVQTKPNYVKQIEPLLLEKCAACHNHTTRKGELNLETYEALMAGGKRGAAIIPGKSSESLLVKMIEGVVKPRMPLGDELSAEEIKLLKAWIDAGAAGPEKAAAKSEPAANESTNSLPNIKPSKDASAPVSAIAFHPDGSLIALGKYQLVELRDAKTSKPVAPISGFTNQVRAVAFSSDGKLLAAAGGNPAQFGEVKIWDVAERRELRTIRGHRDNIFSVAFSPANNSGSQLLATCSYDRMIKLWDVATGNEVKNLKDHTDAVFAVAFSPDGKLLASASADRTVKIWDVATGVRLYTLSDALDAVNSIAFHSSGKLLAGAGADRIIRIWEIGATEGRQVKSLIAHEDAINVIAFSPDGKTLASAAADKSLKLWDAAKLEEFHSAEKQSDWIFSLSFNPDGKRLAVGRYDGSIDFYDSTTGKNSP
jgi:WD40 repeat protein/mono/diheme cytochrome c family protein